MTRKKYENIPELITMLLLGLPLYSEITNAGEFAEIMFSKDYKGKSTYRFLTIGLEPYIGEKGVEGLEKFQYSFLQSKNTSKMFPANGIVRWTDTAPLFCTFMHPISFLHLNTELSIEIVDLPTQKSKCLVEIVTCIYGKSGSTLKFEERYFARGSNGKYYRMVRSPKVKKWLVIDDRIWIPDENHEEAFFKHYQGKVYFFVEEAIIGS